MLRRKEVIVMTEARIVMDDFMRKFNNDVFNKDNQPNVGPEMTDDFIEEKLKSFSMVLNLDVVENALSE